MDKFYIQWHITDRCNLRCIDCYQEKYTRENELSWQQLHVLCDKLIDTMKKWDKELKITLTGGEPLLKEELWDILKYLDKSNYISELSIITNGTIIDKYISELQGYTKLKEIYISLDGITSDSNDSIRGAGTFKKTIDNIKLLLLNNIPVVIMFTLLKRNINDAKSLLNFAENLGVDGFIIERFVPLGQGKKVINEVVSGEELNELYRHIFNESGFEYQIEEVIKYRAVRAEFKPELQLFGAECIVGKDGMALLPDGTILPCRRFNLPIGNLVKSSLDEIWTKSDVLHNVRNKKYLKGKCKTCEIVDCIGCRAMTYALTGDYLAEDPHCWK